MPKKKTSKALTTVSGTAGQFTEVPYSQIKSRDITIELLRLVKDQPIIALIVGVSGIEIMQRLGLLSDFGASILQGTITAMGVAQVMDRGGMAGAGLLGAGAAGLAGLGVAGSMNEGALKDLLWGVVGGAYPGQGLYEWITGK